MVSRLLWAVVVAPPVSGALTSVLVDRPTYWMIYECWRGTCGDVLARLHLGIVHSAPVGLMVGTIAGMPLMALLGAFLITQLHAHGCNRLRHYIVAGTGCGLLASLVLNLAMTDPSPVKSHLMASSIVFAILVFAMAWLVMRPDRARTTQ